MTSKTLAGSLWQRFITPRKLPLLALEFLDCELGAEAF